MNRNTPHILLLITFLLRVMLPVTNVVYFLSELTFGRGGLWTTLYIVSLLCEIAVLAMLAVGMDNPKARRMGAYMAFGLPGLHYAVTLVLFIFSPAARQFFGIVPMIVLTVAYAVTATLAYMTLRSVGDMEPTERKALPPKEINARVESLHEKLDSNR